MLRILSKFAKVSLLTVLILSAQLSFALEVDTTTDSVETSITGNAEHSKASDETKHLALKPFIANYVAFRKGKDIGSAYLQLINLKDSQYELTYQSKVSRFFLSDKRFEKTKFVNDNGSLTPLAYEYRRTGTGPNKGISLTFNEETKTILVDNNVEMEWTGEFDNQLFRVDLPRKLANNDTQFIYNFINSRGEKRQYIFEVMETTNLTLPYGQINAIKVRINRNSSSRLTYAWFAPSLNFNLVRLQQFKDNKEQGDMQLKSFAYL